jgi:hypothetical protein
MSKMGLAQYLNITIKQVSKILRSYDEYVLKIGESIKNDQIYARVLAKILVPELAPDYDLSKVNECFDILNICYNYPVTYTDMCCIDSVTRISKGDPVYRQKCGYMSR